MPETKNQFSSYSILFCLLVAATMMIVSKNWEKEHGVIYADVVSYYAYLPATFIFNDLKLENRETFDKGLFWPEPLPDGNQVIKTTMGMSILYAPFFFISHGIAKTMGWEAYGYSAVYKIGLLAGALIYFFIGLFFLRKILLRYFSDTITALTLLAVTLGTNLLYYAAYDPAMTHLYNFTLINIFVWYSIKWYEKQQFYSLLLLGLLAGFITLIRPSNIIVLFFFFLFGVYSKNTFTQRIRLVLTKFHWFVFMGIAFTLVWIPQFLYWFYITGNMLVNSYPDEQFFWGNPHFIDGFFSYRKGWLIYTPVMAFALLGILLLFKKMKEFSWSVLVFTFLSIYIVVSWWCWWYGGSFGMRSFIDYYGVLAIPMALLFSEFWSKKNYSRIIIFSIVILSVIQNNLFIEKYRKNSLHWDSTTKESFWFNFWHIRPQQGYWELLRRPDYQKALEGIDAYEDEAE